MSASVFSSISSLSQPAKDAPQPWVEKYRPKCVDDIVHQDEIVTLLKRSLESNDFPNLLFYGPPGTGKTSSIIAMARMMFGPRHKTRLLQLNASDERGINVIRENVRKFAQTIPMTSSFLPSQSSETGDFHFTPTNGSTSSQPGQYNTTLKLIILDEADSMTVAAQACLRRTMEIYSKTTRFCLICNYVSRIIEPIASRCSKFRFKPISAPFMIDRLKLICAAENVNCSDIRVLEHLISVCEGDLRQAITLLQSAHRLADETHPLNMDLIQEVSGYVPQILIDQYITTSYSKSISKVEKFVADLVCEGYTASQFMSQLHDWLLNDRSLTDLQASKIAAAMALAEHRLCNGSDEYLQLMFISSVLMRNLD